MVALLVSALAFAQGVPNAAPVQMIVGFDCADRDNLGLPIDMTIGRKF